MDISVTSSSDNPLLTATAPKRSPMGIAAMATGAMARAAAGTSSRQSVRSAPVRSASMRPRALFLMAARRGRTSRPRPSPVTPNSLALSSFEPAPGPATTMSVFFETDPATLAPSRSAMALASSRVICSSVPVNTTVLPATGDLDAAASTGSGVTCASRASSISSLWLLVEELDDRIRDDVSDAADGGEFRIGLRWSVRSGLAPSRAEPRTCRNDAPGASPRSRRYAGCRARR